jgi:hypothetical protein
MEQHGTVLMTQLQESSMSIEQEDRQKRIQHSSVLTDFRELYKPYVSISKGMLAILVPY